MSLYDISLGLLCQPASVVAVIVDDLKGKVATTAMGQQLKAPELQDQWYKYVFPTICKAKLIEAGGIVIELEFIKESDLKDAASSIVVARMTTNTTGSGRRTKVAYPLDPKSNIELPEECLRLPPISPNKQQYPCGRWAYVLAVQDAAHLLKRARHAVMRTEHVFHKFFIALAARGLCDLSSSNFSQDKQSVPVAKKWFCPAVVTAIQELPVTERLLQKKAAEWVEAVSNIFRVSDARGLGDDERRKLSSNAEKIVCQFLSVGGGGVNVTNFCNSH